jgi:hypothetical protein
LNKHIRRGDFEAAGIEKALTSRAGEIATRVTKSSKSVDDANRGKAKDHERSGNW